MWKHCMWIIYFKPFILLNLTIYIHKGSNQNNPHIAGQVGRYFGGSHKISTFTYDNNQHLHINVIFIALKSLVKQNSLLALYTYHLESSLICKIHSIDLAKPGKSLLKQHSGENYAGSQLFFTYIPALTLNFLDTYSWAGNTCFEKFKNRVAKSCEFSPERYFEIFFDHNSMSTRTVCQKI